MYRSIDLLGAVEIHQHRSKRVSKRLTHGWIVELLVIVSRPRSATTLQRACSVRHDAFSPNSTVPARIAPLGFCSVAGSTLRSPPELLFPHAMGSREVSALAPGALGDALGFYGWTRLGLACRQVDFPPQVLVYPTPTCNAKHCLPTA